jgi:hypothetical protein
LLRHHHEILLIHDLPLGTRCVSAARITNENGSGLWSGKRNEYFVNVKRLLPLSRMHRLHHPRND